MSIAAKQADFVFIEKDKGSIFVNPQSVVGNAIGDNPFVKAVDDGTYEWPEIAEKIRKLVGLLPPAAGFAPEIIDTSIEELNRVCPDIDSMIGDGRAILTELSDSNDVLEVQPDFGQDIITGFVRLAGQTVGCVACNKFNGEKRLSADGCSKAAAMVDVCSRFGIPVLTVIDTDGYQTTSENEKYLPESAGRLLRALINATVPK